MHKVDLTENHRLKYILTYNDEVLPESTPEETEIKYVEIGDVKYDQGITNYTDYTFEQAPSRARRIVRDGDVILSTVRTYLKAVAGVKSPPKNLIVSTGFVVLRPKTQIFHPKFASYFFQSEYLLGEVVSKSVGVSYPAVSPEKILDMNAKIPPLKIQKQIANFLDKETTRIDTLISKKQKQIELLQEKRQAIITHAVTKGLNPDVKMKDSGVEWIGEIPEHWEVRKLRYIGTCQNGISKGGEYFGKGYPFVSYGDVYQNIVLPEKVNGLVESSSGERKNCSVEKGDIFFTRTSETIEEIGFASTCLKTIPDAVFAGFLIRVRPKKGIIEKNYSKYYFRADILRRYFVKEMNIVTRASLGQELLKNLPVLLPSFTEMKEIAEYLDKQIKKNTITIVKINESINLLKEYRSSLITHAVTGQIDINKYEV